MADHTKEMIKYDIPARIAIGHQTFRKALDLHWYSYLFKNKLVICFIYN